MRKQLFVILLTISLVLPATALGQQSIKITAGERRMAEGVTAAQLRDYLYFVASDAMEGRDTPSRGLDVTAEFLKMNLSRWGFKPAGDNGTFFQKIELRSESVDGAGNSLQVAGQTFAINEDLFRLGGNRTATGEVVFGLDGWMIKSKNIDAFRGVDVKGKIVVLHSTGFPGQTSLTAMPAGTKQADLTGIKGTDWADPVTYARQSGAAGVILIASPQMQGAWPRVRQFFSRGTTFPVKLRDEPADPSARDFPVIIASEKAGSAIFAGEAGDKTSAAPFQLKKTVTLSTAGKSETKWTQNVVAIWEGSDPVLKNEMVAIGAHYDHVGVNENAPGPDKIWNGADDDGSGTVAVLAIAEALAKSKIRPKRSVLFVWHAGEEKGLWGSEYFNKFPTVDIKQVIAHLNIDMIGRSKKAGDVNPKNKDLSGENAIYVIGSEMMSSTLGAITKGTNSAYLNMTYDYRYDDPADKERFFFRSDHFNYAVNGIPIAFWFDGVHEDYHQPGDHADKIDYTKMEKVTRTIFMTLWELTDLRERPKVDKQLPPELTKR